MARAISIACEKRTRRTADWQLSRSAPSAFAAPDTLDDHTQWLPAHVPGTVAASLERAGLWQFETFEPLETHDFWYRTTLECRGPVRLRFEGLATLAEVFLDGALILTSDNMFLAHEVEVVLAGTHRLHLCFRALSPILEQKRKRARWRPRLPSAQNLRFIRTTLLGHAPGWSPPVHAIGPWRDIVLIEPADIKVSDIDLRAHLSDGQGILDVSLRIEGKATTGTLTCASRKTAFERDTTGIYRAHLELDGTEPWWPHTHGTPNLYSVRAEFDGIDIDLGHTGFRNIEVDHDTDGKGFGLIINGTPIFCRGACWTNADLVGLTEARETYLPALLLMRDAGMNMLRLGGTMVYEGDAFYALCDELGIMIWQDFMFANFDYPADDDAFLISVTEEARQFLARTQASPSITVFCGGSEIAQQAAMFGLPAKTWSNDLFDSLLPRTIEELRPDVPYVPHTPYGGELPFVPHEGVSHYYGVSAYMRPLEDARLAEVRFATECLCFANVPDAAPVSLEPDAPLIAHPHFAARVPGDTGATWYFETVRNFYLELLYGVDAASLRRADPERFLDLSRAVSAEVMEAVFNEWRRGGSRTRGGLVWHFQDLWPGAGWGVVDSLGEPKAAYFGLQRAFKPVTVILTDEGLNGLNVHLVNETPLPRSVNLTVSCLREGSVPVMRATRATVLQPRSTTLLSATELWGGFFDTTYAYRFGPPSHDVTVARLCASDTGATIAEAFHFPLGRGAERHDLGLEAECVESGGAIHLTLATKRLAQSVHIKSGSFSPEDNWFHLAPGMPRSIRLEARRERSSWSGITVAAVNGKEILSAV